MLLKSQTLIALSIPRNSGTMKAIITHHIQAIRLLSGRNDKSLISFDRCKPEIKSFL